MKKWRNLLFVVSSLYAASAYAGSTEVNKSQPHKFVECNETQNLYKVKNFEKKLDDRLSCKTVGWPEDGVCKEVYRGSKTPDNKVLCFSSEKAGEQGALWFDKESGNLYLFKKIKTYDGEAHALNENTPCGDNIAFVYFKNGDEITHEEVTFTPANLLRSWIQGRKDTEDFSVMKEDDPEMTRKGVENVKWGENFAEKVCGKVWKKKK